METKEIYASLKTNKSTRNCFLSVFPIDLLPDRETILQKTEDTYLVINLDPSYKSGSHWVTICLNMDGCNEYFDSYGKKPPEIITNYLKASYILQKKQLQGNTSTVCGQWCIYYIWQKCNGATLKEISDSFKTSQKEKNDRHVNNSFNQNFTGPCTEVFDLDFLVPQTAKMLFTS